MTEETNPYNPNRFGPLMIVISGPSGVGKDTVIQGLKERDARLHFVVTATTREPRFNEVNGVDYFFLSKDEFAEMIEQDKFLEYAVVYNDFKGIPKEQVRLALESGQDVVMRVDVQGAATLREIYPDVLLIFLTVRDEEELKNRLIQRKKDKPEEIKLRIATARQELKRIKEFDYMVVNREDRLDETVETILAIIRAEHHRVQHRKVNL
jgi:guanylate kinase